MKVLQIEQVDGQQLMATLEQLQGLRGEIQSIKDFFQPKHPNEYISRKEVAKLFGVSLVTIHDWTNKGILQAYRIANRIYYKRHEIDAALQKVNGAE